MGEFRTIKGYDLLEDKRLTRAMEDYLEMICRHCEIQGYARVQQIAQSLNVKPSSVTKMAEQLKELGYVDYEKYGYLKPTQQGWRAGEYLLFRHDVLHEFLCMVNSSQDELEQVEKIEHFFDRKTIENLEKMIHTCRSCPKREE